MVVDRPLFSGVLPAAHNWAPAVGLSLVLHFLMVGCAILVQEYLPLFRPASLDGLYTLQDLPLAGAAEAVLLRRAPDPAARAKQSGSRRSARPRLPPGVLSSGCRPESAFPLCPSRRK